MAQTVTIGGNKDFAKIQGGLNFLPGNLSGQGEQAVQVSQKGEVAHFKMNDDAASTVLLDAQGRNNGVLQQNSQDINQAGKINGALSFNGSTDYANIDDVFLNELAGTDRGTWSAWIKPVVGANTSSEIIIGFGDTSAAERLILFRAPGGILRAIANGKWDLDVDANPFSNGVYTHVLLRHNGTEPELFVNAVKVAQAYISSPDRTGWFPSQPGIDNGRIGDYNWNGAGEALHTAGDIDDVRFYDWDLSQGEIDDIYNAGTGTEAGETHNTYYEAPDAYNGFSNQSDTDFISITSMVDHGGQRAAGIIIDGGDDATPGAAFDLIALGAKSKLTGFNITMSTNHNHLVRAVMCWGIDCVVDRCIEYDMTSTGANGKIHGFRGQSTGSIFKACATYNLNCPSGTNTFGFYSINSSNYYNCLSLNNSAGGGGAGTNSFAISGGTNIYKNCTGQAGLVGDGNTDAFHLYAGNYTITYSISTDPTANSGIAPPTGNLINQNLTTQVKLPSIVAGSEDGYIVDDTSVAFSAGVAVAGVNFDIAGVAWNPTPSIGISVISVISAAARRKGLSTGVHLGNRRFNLKTTSKLGA